MKVHKFGQVIVTNDVNQPIKIEDWNIEMEPNDPQDATPEELLVSFATEWALDRLATEVGKAKIQVFKHWQQLAKQQGRAN
jgi:hypothetical protein